MIETKSSETLKQAVWDVIDAYVEACGGDVKGHTYFGKVRRDQAKAHLERILKELALVESADHSAVRIEDHCHCPRCGVRMCWTTNFKGAEELCPNCGYQPARNETPSEVCAVQTKER